MAHRTKAKDRYYDPTKYAGKPKHSPDKRMRQDEKRKERNHFYKKTTRTAIKKLRTLEDKQDAEKFLPKVVSMIDRLVKKGQFHKNKGANLKRKLAKKVQAL